MKFNGHLVARMCIRGIADAKTQVNIGVTSFDLIQKQKGTGHRILLLLRSDAPQSIHLGPFTGCAIRRGLCLGQFHLLRLSSVTEGKVIFSVYTKCVRTSDSHIPIFGVSNIFPL